MRKSKLDHLNTQQLEDALLVAQGNETLLDGAIDEGIIEHAITGENLKLCLSLTTTRIAVIKRLLRERGIRT